MRKKQNNKEGKEALVSPALLEKMFNDEGKTFEELIEEIINQVLIKEI